MAAEILPFFLRNCRIYLGGSGTESATQIRAVFSHPVLCRWPSGQISECSVLFLDASCVSRETAEMKQSRRNLGLTLEQESYSLLFKSRKVKRKSFCQLIFILTIHAIILIFEYVLFSQDLPSVFQF